MMKNDFEENPKYLKIKISTSFPQWPLIRQTPSMQGLWKNSRFFINQSIDECDAWFVYDGLSKAEKTRCPADNVIFINGEPPSTIKYYPKSWLSNFSQVISPHRNLKHPRIYLSQPGPPWFIDKNYDELKSGSLPVKNKQISIICSAKQTTRGHQKRLLFIEELVKKLPVDLFGRGFNELADKWNGLAAYKYSIALENSSIPNYWTEKISDCFLTGTFPFYYGCTNIEDFFPEGSHCKIDINDPSRATDSIMEVIEGNTYEKSLDSLLRAKELVLDKYNLFNLIAEFCTSLTFGAEPREISLIPEPSTPYVRKKIRKILRKFSIFST